MSPAVQVLLVGVGTYLIRLSAIVAAGRLPPPAPSTVATLRLIAPAVLAAIVADQLVVSDGGIEVEASWIVAAVLAGLAAWRWRSAAITMGLGLAVVWIADALT